MKFKLSNGLPCMYDDEFDADYIKFDYYPTEKRMGTGCSKNYQNNLYYDPRF